MPLPEINGEGPQDVQTVEDNGAATSAVVDARRGTLAGTVAGTVADNEGTATQGFTCCGG